MKALRLALVLMVLLASLIAVGCRPTPHPTQEITLAMGYIPNVQFAPLYVAVKKGYFAEEGIQVKFDYGWETDLLKLVGTNELKFAVASGDQVILARSQGLPVVYVMNWYRRYPVSVAALADAGIRTPQDLVGKTVGIPATYGASYVGWRALLYATGISPESVTLQVIGYAQVPALLEKQVDAAVCYVMNEPVQLAQAGYAVVDIPVSDYIDLVSNGFITNEQTIQKEPNLVQGMVRAALRGLQYTLDHPDEAFEISLEFIPEMKSTDIPLQKAVLYKSVEVWKSDRLGESSTAAWQASVDFMKAVGLIQEAPAVNQLFTNRFVEGAKK
ncbi:MAG: ABC transporter substrate-binding protein [Anaerolineales bacterium]